MVLNFAAPNHAPLAVGVYTGATRFPFNAANEPGLDVYGDGRGCNELTGRFEVFEIVYGAGNQIQSFRATFEQHCEGGTPALRGEVRFNAQVPVELSVSSLVVATDSQPLAIGVTALDSLGGHVTLSALDLPSGATFADNGNNTGTFAWTPALPQAGAYKVGFRGQNAQGVIETVFTQITITPSNDNFETPQTIAVASNAGSFDGSISKASRQTGEPGSNGQASVWFKFVAPLSERVVFHTAGSSFDTRLTVYLDPTPQTPPTFADLVQVASGHEEYGPAEDSKLVLETTAGTAYFVSVEGWAGDTTFTLHWRRAELSRLLWRHTNGSITIWTVDGAGTIVSHPTYGPFSGWQAVRLAVGPDRQTRVLWRHSNGVIAIWTLDTAGNIVANPTYGPYAGWTVSDLAIPWHGEINVAWTHTNGSIALWELVPDASDYWSSYLYRPLPGMAAGWHWSGQGSDETDSMA